jgi:SAM-dependent methyltransferase
VQDEQRRAGRRARSFGAVVDAYERGRPSWPRDGVAWLIGQRPARVLDLGAGTGKLTRVVAALGHEVVAVEPDPAMLARLRRLLPGIDARAGSAEAIPLAAASVDVVVCGQAFHWFQPDQALPEMHRVLRPRGRLAVTYNERVGDAEWVARLAAMVEGEPTPRRDAAIHTLNHAQPWFGRPTRRVFSHRQRVGIDTLMAELASRSAIAVASPAERRDLLARAEQLLAAEPALRHGPATVTYHATCYRLVAQEATRT